MFLRRIVLCCALLCSPLAQSQVSQAPIQSYRIAAGPLATTLSQLAQEAGLLFVVDARLTEGKSSPGLDGRYSLGEAFARLLEGSGLQLVREDAHYSLRLIVLPATENGAALPAALPTVFVQGKAEPPSAYQAPSAQAASRTDTPLQDVPQAVTVLSRALIEDQAPQSLADLLRWVPGVGAAQGEGNRDTPVFRGSSSTADFLFDGVRDDVQYYRDLYNIERVEVLKGPNAVLLGHGGVGGLINRVSKVPDWDARRQLSLEAGSWAHRRASLDWNQAFNEALAGRLNALVEASDSYRDHFYLRRSGVNPVLAARLTRETRLVVGMEHFEDERTADRGVPSYMGKPLPTSASAFFGNPDVSISRVRMDAFYSLVEHDLGEGRGLSNRTRYAFYDKFFQNVFPGAVRMNAAGTGLEVALVSHNSQTSRRNLFNQTELVVPLKWGRTQHLLLAGLELGRQSGDNWRQTGYFAGGGTALYVPVERPVSFVPLTFATSPTDPNSRSASNIAGLYLQDQVIWSPRWRAVLGLRHDRLDVQVDDRRLGQSLNSLNQIWSPRVGLIYQPRSQLSLYANHSVGYTPRAGEQYTTLTLSNQALQPEKYVNQELGVKWTPRPGLDATAALYQSLRTRVALADPNVPNAFLLVDGQRTDGVELGLSGAVTRRWQVFGGYAYQEGKVLVSSATLPHLPRHSIAFWNRLTVDQRWAVGLGLSYRSAVYASIDNTVTLAAYTRVDAAVYYQPERSLRLQLNIENLLDRRYDAFAHNNTNITPGAPATLRLGLRSDF